MSVDQDLQERLRAAKHELSLWEQQNLTREDGSPAQDRRFEERGDRLKEEVFALSRQLEQAQS